MTETQNLGVLKTALSLLFPVPEWPVVIYLEQGCSCFQLSLKAGVDQRCVSILVLLIHIGITL